jgi:tripartite-type tricarboxylate transporter receptor subunit TctC
MKHYRSDLALAMCGLALATLPAYAQNFPTRPIRIIVPYTPGGTTDVLARLVGQKLNKAWGQPVIVDNRPGANGIVGTEMVAKSPPDGYRLSIASVGTHAANASLYPTLPYDTIKDFSPITQAVNAPMLLVVHPSLPAKSVKELIALAKSKRDQIPYASAEPARRSTWRWSSSI